MIQTTYQETKKISGLRVLIDILKRHGIFVALIALFIVGSLISDVFFSSRNIFNILRQSSIVGIMAIGMTFVLIGGDIDLSVGSTLSLCMVLAIGLQQQGLALSILIVLIVGILAGLLNGLLVGLFKANAFIVTLGTMSIIQAIALIYSKGYHMLGDPESAFSIIGRGMIGPVPIPVIIFVTFGIIFHIILSNSKFGYSVYATGGNAKAAWASGIHTGLTKLVTFVLTGFTAAVGALVMSSRLASAQPSAGQGYELDVIAAVILGGTSLLGGRGSIFRTVVGALFFAVFSNLMILLNVAYPFQLVIKGAIIICAVWADIIGRRALQQ